MHNIQSYQVIVRLLWLLCMFSLILFIFSAILNFNSYQSCPFLKFLRYVYFFVPLKYTLLCYTSRTLHFKWKHDRYTQHTKWEHDREAWQNAQLSSIKHRKRRCWKNIKINKLVFLEPDPKNYLQSYPWVYFLFVTSAKGIIFLSKSRVNFHPYFAIWLD